MPAWFNCLRAEDECPSLGAAHLFKILKYVNKPNHFVPVELLFIQTALHLRSLDTLNLFVLLRSRLPRMMRYKSNYFLFQNPLPNHIALAGAYKQVVVVTTKFNSQVLIN